MKVTSFFVALSVVLRVTCGRGEDAVFDDDIHYVEPETGGQLRISSKGKLSAIIDLDQTPAVKVCSYPLFIYTSVSHSNE